MKQHSELGAGAKAYEMLGAIEPVDIGEAKMFAVELEGSSVEPLDTSAAGKKEEAGSRSPVDIKRTSKDMQ